MTKDIIAELEALRALLSGGAGPPGSGGDAGLCRRQTDDA